MANVNISPNMSLPVPVPTVDLGPDWAQQLYNCLFSVVDAHDHSPGKGVQITPSGLNLNQDVPLQDNNLTGIRTTRFQPQSSAPGNAADIGCISVVGNELYYNDVTGGHSFPLTVNGSVAGTSGSISGLTGTASASFAAGTFTWLQATGIPANMDAATYILRYPSAGYPTPSGNFIALEAPSTLATGYAITFPANPPVATSFVSMDSSGNLATTITTVGGITASNLASAAVTTPKISDGNVTNAKLAASNFLSTGVSGGGSTSTTPVQFATGSLTTTGFRALLIRLNAVNTAKGCLVITNSGSLQQPEVEVDVEFLVNGAVVATCPVTLTTIGIASSSTNVYLFPASALSYIYTSSPSGTNTYSMNASIVNNYSGNVSFAFQVCNLVVVEL